MKFTFSWLKEHLNTTASLDEVVDALTDLGLEVEEVSDPIRKLNDFTIGKISLLIILKTRTNCILTLRMSHTLPGQPHSKGLSLIFTGS